MRGFGRNQQEPHLCRSKQTLYTTADTPLSSENDVLVDGLVE
ncbi:hypothetical protein [Mesorhizobium sp. M1216]